MRKFARIMLVTVGMLAIVATTAQGSTGIGLSSGSPVTATGRLTMNGSTICSWSLTLNFPATLRKAPGVNQATVSAGSISACSPPIGVNSGVILTPFNIQYASFTGSLPGITGLNLKSPDFGFRLDAFSGFVRCLYGGNFTGMTLNIVGGTLRTATFATNRIPLVVGSGLCPADLTFAGTITVQNVPPTVLLV